MKAPTRLPPRSAPWLPAIAAALLLLTAALVAACSGSTDPHSGEGGADEPGAAHSAHPSAGHAPSAGAHTPSQPIAIPGHNGSHRSRCAACHTAEDREKPRWKEIANQFGHDVAGMLDERTTCNCCHLGEVKGFGEPFEARCLDCHDGIKVTIPKMGQQHCVGCHTLGAGDASDMVLRAWECQKCHADKQGDSLAIDVHGGEDCANCHRPHEEPWTEPRECSDCHARQEAVHHGKAAEGKEGPLCNECHAPHEKAGEAAGKCVTCHAEKHPGIVKTALFPGHDACTNCHAPHAFDKGEATDCTTCHKQRTMAGRGQKEHADCQSCHSTHDVKAISANACAKCHEKVTSSHPDPKGTSCITCHDPHPSATATGTAAALAAAGCASCHSSARTQSADHGELTCQKCHTPHAESKTVVAACKDCHKPQLAAVAAQPKHGDCAGCHTGGAHRPTTNGAVCSSCHTEEHKTAPKGHSDCTKCHDSHSGKQLSFITGCKTCHATEAVGAIALGHKDCNSCHRPHGPDGPASPPTCTTCHQKNKMVGMHSLKGHEVCSSCHTSAHAPAKNDRATCITCHANEKDHQPDAQVCSGCHRFVGQ